MLRISMHLDHHEQSLKQYGTVADELTSCSPDGDCEGEYRHNVIALPISPVTSLTYDLKFVE